MRAALAHLVPGIDAEFGGELTCATCHVYVDSAWQERFAEPQPDELEMLDCAIDPDPTAASAASDISVGMRRSSARAQVASAPICILTLNRGPVFTRRASDDSASALLPRRAPTAHQKSISKSTRKPTARGAKSRRVTHATEQAETLGLRDEVEASGNGGSTEAGGARKLGQRVASRIEAQIATEGWPVGKVLGSEAQLIERFGVSRAVLREAVRIVESHQAARMRRGPNGGLIVTAPEMTAVQASAALFLDYANVSQDDLFEVRSALELAAIKQVVERLDETSIARLRQAIGAEVDQFAEHGIRRHSPDLHVLIAELSGNPALWLFVDVLTRLTQQRANQNVPDNPALADELHRTHTGIVEAIIEGDAGLAQHRMSRHLRAVASYYR